MEAATDVNFRKTQLILVPLIPPAVKYKPKVLYKPAVFSSNRTAMRILLETIRKFDFFNSLNVHERKLSTMEVIRCLPSIFMAINFEILQLKIK